MTPYPACAKTALRIGANTLSAEIERTAGRIGFYPVDDSCLVAEVLPAGKAKASKKRLNFCEVPAACPVQRRASPTTLIGAFSLRKSQLSPIVPYTGLVWHRCLNCSNPGGLKGGQASIFLRDSQSPTRDLPASIANRNQDACAARKSTTALREASGWSVVKIWLACGSMTSFDPAIREAINLPLPAGTSWSISP